MTDTKVIRVDEEVLAVIRQYSDGSISDGIRAMDKAVKEKGSAAITLETVKMAVRDVLLERKQ